MDPRPFPPPDEPRVPFDDAQKAELARAYFDAELAVLAAVTRRAAADGLDAVRDVSLLVTALHGLRASAGQVVGWAPFPAGPAAYGSDWSEEADGAD